MLPVNLPEYIAYIPQLKTNGIFFFLYYPVLNPLYGFWLFHFYASIDFVNPTNTKSIIYIHLYSTSHYFVFLFKSENVSVNFHVLQLNTRKLFIVLRLSTNNQWRLLLRDSGAPEILVWPLIDEKQFQSTV